MTSYQDHFLDLSAEDILGIALDTPERLFKRSFDAIAHTYRALARKFHPDLNKEPRAQDAFEHLKALRDTAKEKLVSGVWHEDGVFTCTLKDGRELRVRSDAQSNFELGTLHISPVTLTYVVGREHEELFKNAIKRIDALAFRDSNGKDDAKMRDVYASHLPKTYKTFETVHSFILVVRKGMDDVRLRDLLPHIPKDSLDRHTAWIGSRLFEMVRYLEHSGVSHNAISLDTVFASPRSHTIGLFGGWWYATPFGEGLKAVPGETVEFLPDTDGKVVLANGKPDRDMLRAVAREMLGDRGGTRLTTLKTAPPPMLDYLRAPSSGDAQKDLTDWYQDVLLKSFGARRFTELPVTYSDVYQPRGVS